MREYKAGEIVEIAFPFEEGVGEKVRPALVIHDYGDELLLLKITSQIKGREYDVAILPDDFNGLTKPSAIEVDKCGKVHKAKLSAIIRYGKYVQSYTKLYYLYYGILARCLPASSNSISPMLLANFVWYSSLQALIPQ